MKTFSHEGADEGERRKQDREKPLKGDLYSKCILKSII